MNDESGKPTILMPTDLIPGFLEIDPPGPGKAPEPVGSAGLPPYVDAPDESANYGAGTWLALGAFAAAGALLYRQRNNLKKVLP